MVGQGYFLVGMGTLKIRLTLHVRGEDVFMVQVRVDVSSNMLATELGMSPRILDKAGSELSSRETLGHQADLRPARSSFLIDKALVEEDVLCLVSL